MDVWSFWQIIYSCYAFQIVPKCYRNRHGKFENSSMSKLTLTRKEQTVTDERTDGPTQIIEKLRFKKIIS